MTDDTEDPRSARPPGLPALPATAFVLVWSSGYIAGPAGVDAVAPFTLLTARFVLAAVVAGVLARVLHGPLRIGGRLLLRICAVGLMMNALQFGLVYLAFDAGLGATLGALMHSLSPVLTVVLAGVLLRERLSPLQVGGFVLGVIGVLVVLGPDVDGAGGVAGIVFGVLSVLSLSLGSLGQRWIGVDTDPLWSSTVQFAVSVPPLALLAVALERTDPVERPVSGLVVILYLALVNSVVGLLLLGLLMRHGGAGASASVFFLMPPVTAVMAWFIFGDTLDLREMAGLVVAVVGVAVATRVRPRVAP